MTLRVHGACSVFQAELADHIPVVKTSIAGTRLVGRLTVGECADRQWHMIRHDMPMCTLAANLCSDVQVTRMAS